MTEETYTTAEVGIGFSLSRGPMFVFRVVSDRKMGSRGLTKGREVAVLVHESLLELLRSAAALIEQSDKDDLEAIIEAVNVARTVEDG